MLRHSREYTRAQRERYIAKRTGCFPWSTAPGGVYAKWTGCPSVRRSMARRIARGKNAKHRAPKYPVNIDAA